MFCSFLILSLFYFLEAAFIYKIKNHIMCVMIILRVMRCHLALQVQLNIFSCICQNVQIVVKFISSILRTLDGIRFYSTPHIYEVQYVCNPCKPEEVC